MLGRRYGFLMCTGANRHIIERNGQYPVFCSIMFAHDCSLDVPKLTYPIDNQAAIHISKIAVKDSATICWFPIRRKI